jgi:hypothetical protein
MPNWVYSFIETDAKHLKTIQEIVDKGGLCRFFVPMPEEIVNTASPNNVISDEEYAERVADGTTAEVLHDGAYTKQYNSESQMREFIEKYGATNWYDWANIYWGTKWGDTDHEIVSQADGRVVLRFSSAWSPVSELILDVFFGYIKQGSYIWEEEQGFGEEYLITDGKAEMVREWDETSRADDDE